MKDRVPLYPGRVKLTPVSGQENTYDMVRADEPTQEGDHLSKATFLKDATAALYGLGADAVPDDVLVLIKQMIDSNYSELSSLANSKAKIATGSYVGTGTYGASNPTSLTFEFEPKLVIIEGGNYGKTYGGYFISGSRVGMCNSTGINFSVFLTWNNDSVSWLCNPDTKSSEYQLNISGATYFYLAIG